MTIDIKHRFHTAPLESLLENNLFEDDSEKKVEEVLNVLEKGKIETRCSSSEAKKQREDPKKDKNHKN